MCNDSDNYPYILHIISLRKAISSSCCGKAGDMPFMCLRSFKKYASCH